MDVIIMMFCIGISMILLSALELAGIVQISEYQITAISLAGMFLSLAALRSATDKLTTEPPRNSFYLKYGFLLLAGLSLFIFPYALHHFGRVQSYINRGFTLFSFGSTIFALALQGIKIDQLAVQGHKEKTFSEPSVISEKGYFNFRLDDQINWYDKKSCHNQKRFKTLRTIEVILSLSLPIIIGYIPAFPVLTLVASLLGAAIAFIATLLALGKYHELWVEYRSICEALKHEKILYQTRTGPYAVENPFPVLVERAEKVMANERAGWTKQQSRKD